MPETINCDIAIAGGGLAAGPIAPALAKPEKLGAAVRALWKSHA